MIRNPVCISNFAVKSVVNRACFDCVCEFSCEEEEVGSAAPPPQKSLEALSARHYPLKGSSEVPLLCSGRKIVNKY